MSKKLEINAIRERDLRALLDSLGLTEKLDAGDLRCPATGEPITWENLGALKVVGGAVQLYSVEAEEYVSPRTGTDDR